MAFVLSFSGVAVIQNRILLNWLNPVLFGVLIWMLLRNKRTAMSGIPMLWSVAMWIAWINAAVWIFGVPKARCLLCDGSDLLLASRASAADLLAIALTLSLLSWYQPLAR